MINKIPPAFGAFRIHTKDANNMQRQRMDQYINNDLKNPGITVFEDTEQQTIYVQIEPKPDRSASSKLWTIDQKERALANKIKANTGLKVDYDIFNEAPNLKTKIKTEKLAAEFEASGGKSAKQRKPDLIEREEAALAAEPPKVIYPNVFVK